MGIQPKTQEGEERWVVKSGLSQQDNTKHIYMFAHTVIKESIAAQQKRIIG